MMKFSHHLYSTIRHFNSQVFFYIKENLIVKFTKKSSIFFCVTLNNAKREQWSFLPPRSLFSCFFTFLISKNRFLKGAKFYSALFMILTFSGEIPVVS